MDFAGVGGESLLACFVPSLPFPEQQHTPKKLQRVRLESACRRPAAIYRNRCSRPSSPPILLSRPHSLPSPSQSRHGRVNTSPPQPDSAAAAACLRASAWRSPPPLHARTHARNPPSGVALSHRPIALFASAALTPSAMQHAFLHAAAKTMPDARLVGIDHTSDASSDASSAAPANQKKDDACAKDAEACRARRHRSFPGLSCAGIVVPESS